MERALRLAAAGRLEIICRNGLEGASEHVSGVPAAESGWEKKLQRNEQIVENAAALDAPFSEDSPLIPPHTLHRSRAVAAQGAARWLLVLFALATPLDCYAYIDPNAGGWLFQLLFPVLVAIGAGWVFLRQKIGKLWDRLVRRDASKDVD